VSLKEYWSLNWGISQNRGRGWVPLSSKLGDSETKIFDLEL
jgi:hypothetical protein